MTDPFAQNTAFRLPRLPVSPRAMRWAFLTLYVLLVAGFFASCFATGDNDSRGPLAMLLAATIATQALLIFGAGTKDLCRPIHRRRLLLPVAVAALMMAVLAAGFFIALAELFYPKAGNWIVFVFSVYVAFNWLAWGALLYLYCVRREPLQVLSRLSATIFTGSLVELLSTVPSHLIVIRRPGCLVGLGTMIGILAGIYAMAWSFGPGIILLFLREKRRAEETRGSGETGAPGL